MPNEPTVYNPPLPFACPCGQGYHLEQTGDGPVCFACPLCGRVLTINVTGATGQETTTVDADRP